MPVSAETFEQLALEDQEGQWELHCGRLRSKPGMSYEHNETATRLFSQLDRQLDDEEFTLRLNMGRVRRATESYYIPDIYVIPRELTREQQGTRRLEVYDRPLPLVVEVWSPSTGEYDVDSKLPEYQRRGDLEIWRVHPYERTLTSWRRQPDGSYLERVFTSGTVDAFALPGVNVDLTRLFSL